MEIVTVLYAKSSFALLDEPFSYLSPVLVEKIIPYIRYQSQTKGIVLTDHQYKHVKEEDQEEAPFIPPRAALPLGATNYVTAVGRQQLLDEKKALEAEKAGLALEDEAEQRKVMAVVNGKLRLLAERIRSARVLYPPESPDEVRFGAKVTLNVVGKNIKQQFQIVGVDEADVKRQKIAFVSPMARAIIGKKVGQVAQLKLGSEVRELQVLDIVY